jgi:N-formylglutamate deformylase
MSTSIFKIQEGNSPLIATAIHDGLALRDELKQYMNLSADERLREEDPFTAYWTQVAPNTITGLHSRFEVDLNRAPEKAVYRVPEDAWGLQVWKEDLPEAVAKRSMEGYTTFYKEVQAMLQQIQEQWGCFVVLDLHTYNHLRQGPDGPHADPEKNPEVNIGTSNMNRSLWAPLVDRFMYDLSQFNYAGRKLDVRENIKFEGGHFSTWIHSTFPDRACSLAIEFKKFFMNEWTGQADQQQLDLILQALKSTLPGLLEEREAICRKLIK